MALSEAISNAFDSQSGSGQDTGTPTQEGAETAPPSESASPAIGLIGSDEQPEQTPPAGQGWQFSDGVDLNAVVAVVDGQEIKYSDLQGGFERQRDYTQKTQALAETLRGLPQLNQWVLENNEHITAAMPLIQALQSGNPQVVGQTLQQLAGQHGVQLESRQRDDRGRFVSQKQDEIDLEAIKEEYGEDSIAYKMAAHNALLKEQISGQEQKYSSLEKKLDGFLGQIQSETEAQQIHSELSQIGEAWAAKGLKADLDGARKLVGQKITPEQAMRLHNFNAFMKHQIAATLAQPQQPASVVPAGQGSQPAFNMHGASLEDTINRTLARG